MEVIHSGLRGAIAAMAMTGMRTFTVNLGLLKEDPPSAVFRQKVSRLLKPFSRKRRGAVVELAHWGYGAFGGLVYGLMPDQIRRAPWAGPIYGLALWAGFETGVAPLLGLRQSRRMESSERISLIGDHLLYGFVLSEMRETPRR